MEKVIFSAIAMIAFVGSSLASGIGGIGLFIVDKENPNVTELALVEKGPKNDFCANVAADVLCELDPFDELSNVGAHNLFQIAYAICMRSGS
jgi:hypothetical protein